MSTKQENEVAKSSPTDAKSFAEQAEEKPPGLIAEFVDFLIHNKAWWITPIVFVLLVFAGIVIFGGGSAAAPFIYTIF